MYTDLNHLTVSELLNSIGAKTPTPGGGAVAGITLALSAAISRMVVNYSLGKKSLAEHESVNQIAIEQLSTDVHRAITLANDDKLAYERLSDLWKLDPSNDRRKREWNDVVTSAITPPHNVIILSLEIIKRLIELCETTNRNLRSDLAIGAILAEAAAQAAMWNVRVNLPLFDDRTAAIRIEDELNELLQHIHHGRQIVETACGEDDRESKP